MNTKANRSVFSRLSIKQRLPLLICALLLVCIAVYGFANYYMLKKADLIIGKDRLHTVTDQMNASFGQIEAGYVGYAATLSKQPSILQFIKSGGGLSRTEAEQQVAKLKRDTTWVMVELLDKNFRQMIYNGDSNIGEVVNLKQVIADAKIKSDSVKITKLYRVKATVYYPLILPITENGVIAGYVIAWKSILTTPKAVELFSKFVGFGANFLVGNSDGTLWTDFTKPIASAPFGVHSKPGLQEYKVADGSVMIADFEPIPHTGLVFGIAVSEKSMLKDLAQFLDWIVVIGIVILATGITAAWAMSRKITQPLDELMKAASAIAHGNYTHIVPIDRYQDDEIGRLARAFNAMIGQVSESHHDLENKVEERTQQLATVNKELEAFSYSVSHDLRTPLRAINGYSMMLSEDYENELDTKGKRIVWNIISNARMMGQLIDDLLTFSRLGKKELVRGPVDMQGIAETIVRELLLHEPENKYEINIGVLPPARGDRAMMKQVLINLVGNAIKYSSKKEHPVIGIGANDEETKTTYYVRDNGAGFDMAYSSKLFGVFQRLHSQEDFEGSGVGLALVKRMIEKHNGEVWAEGAEDIGATFYFTLPKFKLYE